MRRRGYLTAVGTVSLGGIAGCAESGPAADEPVENAGSTDWPSGPYTDYEATTISIRSAEGKVRGDVRVAVADTSEKRYVGLSDADSLPTDSGMLFVYNAPRESLTYVMREMDFGIDIIYVDGNRNITRVHHAPEPGPNEDGNEQRYPGAGQYVLEVPYEWTERNGVEVGDSLAFER